MCSYCSESSLAKYDASANLALGLHMTWHFHVMFFSPRKHQIVVKEAKVLNMLLPACCCRVGECCDKEMALSTTTTSPLHSALLNLSLSKIDQSFVLEFFFLHNPVNFLDRLTLLLLCS